jgi:hypothetical protein
MTKIELTAEEQTRTIIDALHRGPSPIRDALAGGGWHPAEEPGMWWHPSRPGLYFDWIELAAAAITQWDVAQE